jgi:hypothetical protein
MAMIEARSFDEIELKRVVHNLSDVRTREQAVSELIRMLDETETAESLALIKGFAQTLRLYEGDEILAKPFLDPQVRRAPNGPSLS